MKAMRGVLVAGTDTNVGKTFVASALCRLLRRRGVPVVGLKPFETGCQPEAADAAALEREARSGVALDLRCPVRYRAPLAPAAAAEREGLKGTLADALKAIRLASVGRVAVVEAAGGLFVPLDGRHTNLDLAVALGLPVILVGRNALGTLNHLALSVEALRRRRLPVSALVLSRGHSPADPSQASNARWARQLTGVPVVLPLPRTSVQRASVTIEALFELAPLARLLTRPSA
jgi:dethiobiotin synthetase